MGVTIHVNGRSNSLVHKGCGGLAKCTLPDVCKTPSPGGPVPIPYPVIVSMASDLKKGSKKVKFDGGKSAAIKGSEFSRCSGDEAGTAGGVKSSTNMKEATWILYSFDVKIEGKNACRLSDKMMMNHGNTACLAGFGGISVEDEKILCPICGKDLDEHPDLPKMKDKALMKEANDKIKARKGTIGGAKVGSKTASAIGGGASPAKGITHLSGKLIPQTPQQIKTLEKGGNPVGNCAEPKVLLDLFITQKVPFNKAAVKKLKMGVGKKFRKGTKKSDMEHLGACATCKRVLKIMLCTEDEETEDEGR